MNCSNIAVMHTEKLEIHPISIIKCIYYTGMYILVLIQLLQAVTLVYTSTDTCHVYTLIEQSSYSRDKLRCIYPALCTCIPVHGSKVSVNDIAVTVFHSTRLTTCTHRW